MIQLVPQLTILVAFDPVDFRKGIDGLVAVVRDRFKRDPFSGTVFLFRNRTGTAVKLLVYDGQGFWLILKRYSEGKLRWWPKPNGEPLTPLAANHVQVLLSKGDPTQSQMAEPWRQLPNGL